MVQIPNTPVAARWRTKTCAGARFGISLSSEWLRFTHRSRKVANIFNETPGDRVQRAVLQADNTDRRCSIRQIDGQYLYGRTLRVQPQRRLRDWSDVGAMGKQVTPY